uniref:Bax inhibitor 1 n=1 Tax=Steinernema glaseri TaxID=37863 RepID=A0A1I8ARN6_9BILA
MATLFDRVGDRYFSSSSNQRRNEPGFFDNFSNIFTTLDNKLEKDVREHLRNVYGALSLSLMAATVGALGFFVIPETSFLRISFLIGSIACMLALAFTPATRNNELKRLGFLLGVAALSGYNLGPLLEAALDINPKLIFNAFMISGCVFGCFSFSALYADSNKFLHLGGIISSVLMCMMMSIFFGGHMNPLFTWVGLAVSCALVLYDTQKIVYKKRIGDSDYIWHTLDLFLDFIDLFRYILTILVQKERNNSSNNKKKNED